VDKEESAGEEEAISSSSLEFGPISGPASEETKSGPINDVQR
jgi:hypothetical protein